MAMSGGAWSTVRRKVLDRDQGCCYLCGKLGSDEVDHLIEVADGGTNRMDNLASCHSKCHRRKHRDPEWAAERVEMALSVLRGVPPVRGASRFDRGALRLAEVSPGARQSETEGN
jgi:HNH endonuclease